MFKQISFLAAIAVFGLSVGFADQAKKKIVIPVDNTNPANGKQMYTAYCAPCHGVDGRGAGPVAGELKRTPTDLTILSRDNNGKFPKLHVLSVLRFGAEVPAHGTAPMPVWGRILGNMNPVSSEITDLRIANLTHYLESLQKQ
jgi:mono/diheme cytochrome c family protein